MLRHPCFLGDSQQRGRKSELVASPLPSRGPKRGRKCYVSDALLGIPNSKHREKNQKWSPIKGNKSRSGCLTLAFLGAQKRAQMLCHPGILGDPQHQARGAKSKVVPNERKQNQKWPPHPCLLGGPEEGGNATSPLHSWGTPTPSAGSKIRSGPQSKGTKAEVAASPLPSWEPQKGRKCYVTPALLGNPNSKRGEQNQKWSPIKWNKIRSGCLTPAFWGGQKRAQTLRHPCILGDPQHQARGAKSEVVPNKRKQNQKWLPHPCLLGGPKKGRKCYVTPAFLGIPIAKRGEQNQKRSPIKGNKSRSGYLTPAFLGAQKRAQMLRHPCILGEPEHQVWGAKSEVVPNQWEQIQKWLPHPCLLGGPKEGGNAMSPLHSRGSPTPSAAALVDAKVLFCVMLV